MSDVSEYELKLDWVRIDDISEDSDDPVGEIYGRIELDEVTLWQPTVDGILGGKIATHMGMRAGEFFKFPKDRSSRRHFDDDAPQQSAPFHLKIQLMEKDDWNADDKIAKVDAEIRPDPSDFNGKASVTTEKIASADGKITYRYTLTRIG
ncbi:MULTISPECIES: hypothetical protein [unclassified Kitasatospora]|uniref:hypothetical protein n=1 Tax=unclassified Kitasatospora TaxID=2633591 RepID=UPI00339EE865